MKVNVQFTVTYDATVEVKDTAGYVSPGDLEDAVNDIEIPENEQCKYARDSFEPITDDNGDIKLFGCQG